MESKVKTEIRPGLGLASNLAIALLAFAGIVAMQLPRQQGADVRMLDPELAEQQEAIQLELIERLPTLGFDNLIADWAFLKFLIYFGDDQARAKTNSYALNDDYFDLISKRDPRFTEAYLFISTAVSFSQGKPEIAIELMERAIAAANPERDKRAYLLWRYKGIDKLLLLGDIPGSIRAHEMAAEWVKGTPDEALATPFQQMAAFLKGNPNSENVRFWAWSDVYYNALNDKVRQKAEEELLKLGATKKVEPNGEVSFVRRRSESEDKQ
ncbi:MAG: hypothetical protein F6J93_32210 [Oscillatoria sp. SIO1A7]|nr:hypothetical protein [Oscillatoria sp. SIO1A7]